MGTKPSSRTIKILAITSIIFVLFITGCGIYVTNSNKEIDLRNRFTQKTSERVAFYDKMWKTLSGKSQVALKNDSSFRENVNIIMTGRKDAKQVFFKWITESNPNANFGEVSALYKDLSRAIESEREGFFVEEKMLQDIKLQHDNLRHKWPSSWVVGSRKELVYKPVSSDRTDDVFKTMKDNNAKVF